MYQTIDITLTYSKAKEQSLSKNSPLSYKKKKVVYQRMAQKICMMMMMMTLIMIGCHLSACNGMENMSKESPDSPTSPSPYVSY